ncbi:unnamed protein product [Euphydryas editha]|uniref:Uncharacterized protein n=1 Tax=Euphydryas editha TaxID=104508 RepID=A0AAU9TC48_EUPED|nr:unnamed protein product [Euphydryas editha]
MVREPVFQFVTSQQKYRYVYDQLGITDKDKIRNLTHELLVDAKYKIHQTDGIRDECSRDIGFQIGMVIGQIREKYKSMLEIYRQTRNKHIGKSKIEMPRLKRQRSINYFVRLEWLIALETDIDRLVHILETTPSYRFGQPKKP